MVKSYIEPRFVITSSYEKLQELDRDDFSFLLRHGENNKQIRLHDILQRPLVFIVAEPGHGKTRLIDELSQRAGEGVKRVDFKTKVDDRPIGKWLAVQGVSAETKTVLLDGLDEAPAKYIQSTIFSLVEYISTHPGTRFYISCRVHYFAKYQQDFTRLPTAEFLLIKPLERSKAQQLLRNMGIPERTIATLFSSLQFGDSATVLQNPRYLEMIAKEIASGASKPDSINRAMLFESFTFGALCEEDSKTGRQLAEYKKRMLELLALTMEVAQLNQITTDDFVTFMERAKSDAKLIVSQVEIENIYEHSLLTKDLDNNVSFTNREVQEYLAARYLLRMANPEYKVFSLAVEPELREIIPSWRNTLSFIIDELPAIARQIVDLYPARIILDESTELLVSGSTSGKMLSEDKSYIFDYIWQGNNRQQNFIRQELSFQLASYAGDAYVPEACKQLLGLRYKAQKDYPTDRLNVINLCGNLLALDRFSGVEKQKVIEKLIKIALEAGSNTMQINALHALMSVKEKSVLKRLYPLSDSQDDGVFGYIERLAYEIDPSGELSIDVYAKGIKRQQYYSTREGIEKLTTPEAIGYFLKHLASDTELIKPIIDHDRMFTDERSRFLQHVKDVWQPVWLPLLKEFILHAFAVEYGYYAERSQFVEQIMRLIAEHDTDYYQELLTVGVKNHSMMVRLDSSLAKIMQPQDTRFTADVVRALGDKGFIVFRIFECLASTSTTYGAAILGEARQLLPSQFAEYDKRLQRFKRQNKYNSATAQFNREYEKIEDDTLSNALWQTSAAIIRYLEDTSTSKEVLSYTDDQVDRIWHILRTKILDVYDPADITLTITKRGGGNTSYAITRTAELFERAFVFGHLTKQKDIGQYKDKLLAYFPYMHSQVKQELFANLRLSGEEYQKIVDAYADVSKDSVQYQPYDFIELVDTARLVSAKDVLQKIVLSDDMQEYVREYALRTIENIAPDKNFLEQVYERYSEKPEQGAHSLPQSIDTLLIEHYADKVAVQRRLTLMKEAAVRAPARAASGSFSVSDVESELYDKTLAKPLMGLSSDVYTDNFLKLLNYSFELRQKGAGWARYAEYIWEVTTSYFQNLVSQKKSVGLLQRIGEVLDRHSVAVTANYLRYFNTIKNHLLEQLGDKKLYTEAITIVNTMNTTDELKITSEVELYYATCELIKELDRWLQQEGEVLVEKGTETETQRRMALQFENILVKKYGSTNVRTRIDRETQATDGTRTDFYVYFGFYGPVLIELKLSSHGDLAGDMKEKESYKSLQKYMKQFGANHGILLIYRAKGTAVDSFRRRVAKARKAYGSIPGVAVMTLGEVG